MFNIISANPAERKKLYVTMQKQGGHSSPSMSRELGLMVDMLGKGEEILAGTSCSYFRGIDSGSGTLFITNKRVVILNKGFLWGSKSFSIKFGALNSVEFKSGLMSGCLSFRDSDVKYKAGHLDKRYAKHMAQLLGNLV